MRPDTIFEWYDQSAITKTPTKLVMAPNFLVASSCEKGPEDIREVSGKDFYKLYGNEISFVKHGQPLIQAAHVIDNGGKLLFKRLVADDAALANITIMATVTNEQVEKKDASGNTIYIDPATNQETTTDGGGFEVATKNVAKIKYTVVTVPGKKTMAEVLTEVQNQVEGDTSFPIITVTDNGRGASTKRFNIVPNYQLSKQNTFQFYQFSVVGAGEIDSEYTRFSVDPDIIYLNNSMSLTESSKSLTQVDCYMHEDGMNKLAQLVSEASGVDVETLKTLDLLFGCDRAGKPLDYISVDTEQSEDPDADNGYNLQESVGIMLASGDNGEFGDKPFGTEAWTEQAVKLYNGDFDDSIFNPNQFVIDAVVDANYPIEVKKTILELARFREDFFYFRDAGLDRYSFDHIKMAAEEYEHDKFAATYITTYDVIDPYSRKQINVTMMYSMAVALINHFNVRRHSPCCGWQYGFIFNDAIKGTVNFIPKYTPKVDQKTELMDLGLNYCSYISNNLVLETTNTSQSPYSQLSYVNNILAVQQIIHRVREVCPIHRYTFITSDDLESYKKTVNDAIMQYKNNFDTLEFVYVADPIMKANKIFNASIKVSFKDFVQTEIFKIYALPTQN